MCEAVLPQNSPADELKRITGTAERFFSIPDDVVRSIETTPLIAAEDPDKIKTLYDLGYRRIIMGVHTVSERLHGTEVCIPLSFPTGTESFPHV